jgi:pimeloyl-ACP methyl ester carboxylesterase
MMSNKFILIIGFTLFVFSSFTRLIAEDEATLLGIWNGQLSVNSLSLPLKFKINENSETDVYDVLLDSPKQLAYGIPGQLEVVGQKIKMTFLTISAELVGSVSASGNQILGTWRQSGREFPITLKLGESAGKKQTFNYQLEKQKVLIFSRDPGIKLTGELISSTSDGSSVVLLVSGSGPSNIDGGNDYIKPFEEISNYLASKNIASLRFNDRGVNGSNGSYFDSSVNELVLDVLGAIDFLSLRFQNIFLLGHSEGGLISAISSQRTNNISGIIALGPSLLPYEDLIMFQLRQSLMLSGENIETLSDRLRQQERFFDVVKSESSEETKISEIAEIFSTRASASEGAYLNPILLQWMKNRLTVIPIDIYNSLQVPILVLYGDADSTLPLKDTISKWDSTLLANNTLRATICVFPGLNHFFSKESNIESTAESVEYLDLIALGIETKLSESVNLC